VISQELLIREVMADVSLDAEKVTATTAFINSSDEKTSSLGGYKLSKGFLLGFPYFVNCSSPQVSIL
jgi:hypothetical protein